MRFGGLRHFFVIIDELVLFILPSIILGQGLRSRALLVDEEFYLEFRRFQRGRRRRRGCFVVLEDRNLGRVHVDILVHSVVAVVMAVLGWAPSRGILGFGNRDVCLPRRNAKHA